VVILGVLVRGPLSRVPENTLKFVVGIMLTAFGLFWGAEGAGAIWPGSDAALLLIVPGMLVFALALVALFRPKSSSAPSSTRSPVTEDPRPATGMPAAAGSGAVATAVRPQVRRSSAVTALRTFAAFWVDFLLGDDWRVAALVAVGIAGTAGVAIVAPGAAWIVLAAVTLGALPYSAARALR
jgi:hypothetical protein